VAEDLLQSDPSEQQFSKLTAVSRMIKKAMMWETAIPIEVSARIGFSCDNSCSGTSSSAFGLAPLPVPRPPATPARKTDMD
jgi:hypothetical protein